MILIAGVGYSHLTDLSFGPQLVDALNQRDWPDYVQVEDLSYGPITVLQWFQDHPGRFDQAIFIGAMQREDTAPGELRTYRWNPDDLSEDVVHERVAEGVTGIVSLENLLMILDYFAVLPGQPLVIEFEPVVAEWGLDLSPVGQRQLAEVIDVIDEQVLQAHAYAAEDFRTIR